MTCDGRREDAAEEGCERRERCWRGEEGTELRSGAMVVYCGMKDRSEVSVSVDSNLARSLTCANKGDKGLIC